MAEYSAARWHKRYEQACWNRPIPPHTPFKLTKEEYYSNPRLRQNPLLLYCPAKETAIWLDPEDPWDRRLLDAYNNKKPKRKEVL